MREPGLSFLHPHAGKRLPFLREECAWHAGLGGFLLLACLALPARGNVVFAEAMDNSFFGWTSAGGDDPESSDSMPEFTDGEYLMMNDAEIWTSFPYSIADSWTLRLKARHASAQQILWFALLDYTGTRGYVVQWDSANTADGFIGISTYNATRPPRLSDTFSGSIIPSGHPATTGPMAEISLVWDAVDRTLSLSVDGVVKQVLPATAVREFRRLYLRSDATSYFDEILVETEGPAAQYEDDFSIEWLWSPVAGSPPSRVPDETGAPGILKLNNGVLRSTYFLEVSESWSLGFDARHSARSRALWAGVFNEAGTQGYGVLWDSAASGTGTVTIRKFDLTGPPQWSDAGIALTSPARSGHDPTDPSMARLELTWDSELHLLTVNVDGIPRARVVDDSFSSFRNVYLRGNTSSFFDNVTLLSRTPPDSADINFAYNLETEGGAVGDGVTDNRAAILNALTSPGIEERGLYIPTGVFAYSGSINVGNVHLFGRGHASVLQALDPNHRALHLSGNGAHVSSLRLRSATTSRATSPASAAIHIMPGGNDFMVSGVHFEGSNSAGVIVTSSTLQRGVIAESWFQDMLSNAVHINGGRDIQVVHNRIRNTGDDGISIVHYETQASPDTPHDIFVADHDIVGVGRAGIAVAGANDVTIQSNRIYEWKIAGVRLQGDAGWNVGGPDGVVVFDNRISQALEDGTPDQAAILVLGTSDNPVVSPVIIDNQITGRPGTEYGVFVGSAVSLPRVDDNRISNFNTAQVAFVGAVEGGRVLGNRFSGGEAYSIFIDTPEGTGRLTINDNVFFGVRRTTTPSPIAVIYVGPAPQRSALSIAGNQWLNPPSGIVQWFMEIHDPNVSTGPNSPNGSNWIWIGP